MNIRQRVMVSLVVLLGIVGPARADGLIVVPAPPGHPRPWPTPFPLEVRYHKVEVEIKDLAAVTRIDQVFYNPTGARLEGTYLFPLPKGAVINNFSMDINGRMVAAELMDAKKARGIYEEIVRKMRDPALLEYADQGAFKVRIFPIEPRSEKRVKISYTQLLKSDGGLVEYKYPLNTEKFSAQPVGEVSVRVNLQAGNKIRTVFCPSHEAEIKRHGDNRVVIGFEAKNVKPDTDFVLYYDTSGSAGGLSLLTHRIPGEAGYFLLTASPVLEAGKEVAKDITFVIDTSGSMSGRRLDQVKRALLYCLENLNAGDRFQIVRFSTEAEELFDRYPQPANPDNVRRARTFVEGMKAAGGTNMEEGLAMALRPVSDGPRPWVVVFLTDGKPTIGETQEEPLLEKIRKGMRVRSLASSYHAPGKTRIFTFGVGDDLSTRLLDRIADETGGARAYLGQSEDIERKIAAFYDKIKSPVLTDVTVSFGAGVSVSKTHPRKLPDMFAGTPLTVFGRYEGAGGVAVTLEGIVEGRKKAFRYTAEFPRENDANDFIPALWAAQRVGWLLDEIRLRGETTEVKDEVTELARRYGIITPYTSYLIVEDEKARVSSSGLPRENATLGGAVRGDRVFEEKMRREYDAMNAPAGAPSVQASREVEALKKAGNKETIFQGQLRLGYTAADGSVQNLAAQVRNVQGRAVYQNGNQWVDSRVQTVKNQQANRIQFASREYFDLLKQEPASAQFLALGKNVRFALNARVYEIYE